MGSLLLNKTIIKHSQNALFEQKRKSNLLCSICILFIRNEIMYSYSVQSNIFTNINPAIYVPYIVDIFMFTFYLLLSFSKKTIINYDLPAKNESEITMQGEGHFLLLICCFDNQFGKEAPRFFFFPSMIYLTIKTCKRNM